MKMHAAKTISIFSGGLLLALTFSPLVEALSSSSAMVQWTPTTDPTIRYELRWANFNNNWVWTPIAIDLDSTKGQYAQTFPPLPDTTGDRGACWDARAVQPGRTPSQWLSALDKQVCTQMPVGVSLPNPIPLPNPVPDPVPSPEPAPVPVPTPSAIELHLMDLDAAIALQKKADRDLSLLIVDLDGQAKNLSARVTTLEATLAAMKKEVCSLTTTSTLRNALRRALGATTGCAK